MRPDLTTILGVTFVLIALVIIVQRPEQTNKIIEGLANAYQTGVRTFINPIT